MKWTIANKLAGGFASIIVMFTMAMGVIFFNSQTTEDLATKVAKVRTPTVLASSKALNATNESLASLRGYMLLKDKSFMDSRKASMQELEEAIAELEELSAEWSEGENLDRLRNVRENIVKLRDAQQEIEEISSSEENIPSLNILVNRAAPQAAIMATQITAMIDFEKKRDATALRKRILGMMADVRGSLGLGIANIRAYLLTGDTKYKMEFDRLWAVNTKRFGDLGDNKKYLNGPQREAFDMFESARAEFVTYPAQMFESRQGEDWNIANYWLKTKAAPLALSITNELAEMTEVQQSFLITDTDQMLTSSAAMKYILIVIVLLGMIGALTISSLIIRSVKRPLARMNSSLSSIANGDLTIQVDTRGDDEIASAMRNMDMMVKKLRSVISNLTSASQSIAEASLAMSSTSQQMSQGTQEQAASAEEISSSMEQMAANIEQNTDNSQATEKIALKASEDAQQGSDAVSQTVDSMKRIASKVGIIGEIARQTNLLALNAAVEAARAGEHGRGFAVVAAEVRKLAERSQKAAAEINELSVSSLDVADKSLHLLGNVVPGIENTSKLVQEITASSLEQSNGADQVNNAMQQFNQIIQQNAAASEEVASGAEELSSQAESLKESISFFKVGNDVFTDFANNVTSRISNEINLDFAKARPTPSRESGHANGAVIELDKSDDLDKDYVRF